MPQKTWKKVKRHNREGGERGKENKNTKKVGRDYLRCLSSTLPPSIQPLAPASYISRAPHRPKLEDCKRFHGRLRREVGGLSCDSKFLQEMALITNVTSFKFLPVTHLI